MVSIILLNLDKVFQPLKNQIDVTNYRTIKINRHHDNDTYNVQ